MSISGAVLQSRCDRLRSLHRPGSPVLLPNAWDVASARAVVAAGFPVVATTSEAVAATLGHEDAEHAPAEEMLAAAARIANDVDVPVTVDAEAGYGMDPDELVAALRRAGAAGCNLEDTDHATGRLRDPGEHAEWLRAVRRAAKQRIQTDPAQSGCRKDEDCAVCRLVSDLVDPSARRSAGPFQPLLMARASQPMAPCSEATGRPVAARSRTAWQSAPA